MLRDGKIFLFNVGAEVEHFEFRQGTEWLRDVLVRAAPNEEIVGLNAEKWADASTLEISLDISKLAGGEDFSISGRLKAEVVTSCARCTENLKVLREGEFHLYLKQVNKIEVDEVDSGDPDLIFVAHPEFDLRDAMAEQLMMLEPFAEFPETDSQGKSHICAEIQSIPAGQESGFEAMSAFSKLATLKQGES
ncbi:hypothetical protein GW916_11630 [bacterium]|nr:hypothetical protein [bacterium]